MASLLSLVLLAQVTQKTMLSTWSKLYKVFARCSALVITAEENICCEELCSKMTAAIDREALKVSIIGYNVALWERVKQRCFPLVVELSEVLCLPEEI